MPPETKTDDTQTPIAKPPVEKREKKPEPPRLEAIRLSAWVGGFAPGRVVRAPADLATELVKEEKAVRADKAALALAGTPPVITAEAK